MAVHPDKGRGPWGLSSSGPGQTSPNTTHSRPKRSWPRGPFQIAARAVVLGFGPFVIKSRHHLTPEFLSLFFSQKKNPEFSFPIDLSKIDIRVFFVQTQMRTLVYTRTHTLFYKHTYARANMNMIVT